MPNLVEEMHDLLSLIEKGQTKDLTATFWQARYKQDITYLLEDRARYHRELKDFSEQTEKILTIAQEQGKKIEDIQQVIKVIMGS